MDNNQNNLSNYGDTVKLPVNEQSTNEHGIGNEKWFS